MVESMSNAERIIIKYLSACSAATTAMIAVIVAAPGDALPQSITLGMMALSGGLAAFVAFVTKTDAKG